MEQPRWKYRFDHFEKAFFLLKNAILQKTSTGLSQLEEEGVIQRFEYTIELAWKTMKDYLESENVLLEQITPRAVIRQAFTAKLITDGTKWQEALDDRNKMSNTYNIEDFELIINKIESNYLALFEALHQSLQEAFNQ